MGSRVRFDFDGSLALARKLWLLAEAVGEGQLMVDEGVARLRSTWVGEFAERFDAMIESEDEQAARLVVALEEVARHWAQAWADAMDEQNRINRELAVAELRERRSWMEAQVGDRFLGDDSDLLVRPAPVAVVPVPPQFLATQHEVSFL